MPRSTLPTAKAKVSATGEMTKMRRSANVEAFSNSFVNSMVERMAVGYSPHSMAEPVPASVVFL